jgi:hypothetical protein
VNTEKEHESTRVLAPADDSVLCPFTIYQQMELPETYEQPLVDLSLQFKSNLLPPSAPAKPGWTPVRSGTLAISLCGHSQTQLIPKGTAG